MGQAAAEDGREYGAILFDLLDKAIERCGELLLDRPYAISGSHGFSFQGPFSCKALDLAAHLASRSKALRAWAVISAPVAPPANPCSTSRAGGVPIVSSTSTARNACSLSPLLTRLVKRL